jgi:four helix bundle protein
MQDYRNLKVWEKAHALTQSIYQLTKIMPKEETYGLVTTMRRTAVSIPTKIADACGGHDEHFAKMIWQAGSATKEMDYLLLLAKDLEYIPLDLYLQHAPMIAEIGKMLSGLMKRTTN